MQLRSLSWFCNIARLPQLKATLATSVCQAFSHPESLPPSLSFVVWLEKLVLDPSCSAAGLNSL